jgi:hypothetical protein
MASLEEFAGENNEREISLAGVTFIIILAQDNKLYTSITAICKVLDIHEGPQLRRIRRKEKLKVALHSFVLSTTSQLTYCLQVDQISVWLEGLQFKDPPVEHIKKKLNLIQNNLAKLSYAAFSLSLEDATISASHRQEIQDAQHIEDEYRQQQMLFSTKSNTAIGLVVSSLEEDRAFRESCLHKDWLIEQPVPYYIASNAIHVYLEHPKPNLPPLISDTRSQIGALGESTVLTARIALGLWNARRHDPEIVGEDGSVPIGLHEILEWRGIKKHSRSITPGSSIRTTDGYESKYKEAVYRDFCYLQNCYLMGKYSLMINGTSQTFTVEGPYMRVSVVRKPLEGRLWHEEEVVGFYVAPGAWINTHTGIALHRFTHIDRRIFQLDAGQHQLAIRIILYLVERWCFLSFSGNFAEPITMHELLTASMIEIDSKNFLRFSTRIEKSIKTLMDEHLLGEPARCITLVDKNQPHWREDWLAARWSFIPNIQTVQHYQKVITAMGPLLLAPPQQEKKKGRPRKNI